MLKRVRTLRTSSLLLTYGFRQLEEVGNTYPDPVVRHSPNFCKSDLTKSIAMKHETYETYNFLARWSHLCSLSHASLMSPKQFLNQTLRKRTLDAQGSSRNPPSKILTGWDLKRCRSMQNCGLFDLSTLSNTSRSAMTTPLLLLFTRPKHKRSPCRPCLAGPSVVVHLSGRTLRSTRRHRVPLEACQITGPPGHNSIMKYQ